MMPHSVTGILVLAYPLCQDKGELFVNEATYVQLIKTIQLNVDQIQLVARKRVVSGTDKAVLHLEMNQLALELPDFGIGGVQGLGNAIRFFFSPLIYRRLAYLFRHADFIYVEGPSLESLLIALVAWWIGRPIILGCRGDVTLNTTYMRQRYGRIGRFYSWLFTQFFSFARQQAGAALFVSEDLQKKYPIRGALHQVISDVYLPDELFNEPRQFSEPARNLLYVGHLEQIKRVDLMLQALAQVQGRLPAQWHFCIIGDGPLRGNLQQLAEELAIEKHVLFLGRITWGPELFAHYQTADVLLMASTSEGASRTLMEAMAQGLPAISTAVGTAPDLLLPSALVPNGNVHDYAQVLANILLNPAELTRLSAHNWQVIQSFRFERLQTLRLDFWRKAIQINRKSPLNT